MHFKLLFTIIILTISSKQKKQTNIVLIDEKIYTDFIIYFTRYNHRKSLRMLSLYYHKLMEKIEEHEGKR